MSSRVSPSLAEFIGGCTSTSSELQDRNAFKWSAWQHVAQNSFKEKWKKKSTHVCNGVLTARHQDSCKRWYCTSLDLQTLYASLHIDHIFLQVFREVQMSLIHSILHLKRRDSTPLPRRSPPLLHWSWRKIACPAGPWLHGSLWSAGQMAQIALPTYPPYLTLCIFWSWRQTAENHWPHLHLKNGCLTREMSSHSWKGQG